jgi:hypothetical protein
VKTTVWMLHLAAIAVLPTSPAPANAFEVTVIVVNGCTQPAGVVPGALKTAAELLAPTGVILRFTTIERGRDAADAIWLRLMNRAPREMGQRVLGAAIMNEQPRAALVFCDRVMEFAHPYDSTDTGVLLGYAISHELGHLLRNKPGHCRMGVMKAIWRQTDIVLMLQRVMAFSSEDRADIQAGLAARDQTPRITARAK